MPLPGLCVCSRSHRFDLGGNDIEAFGSLKNDHKQVADIFEKLEPTTERAVKTRIDLFQKLNEEGDMFKKRGRSSPRRR
jgi:hypothetical protein